VVCSVGEPAWLTGSDSVVDWVDVAMTELEASGNGVCTSGRILLGRPRGHITGAAVGILSVVFPELPTFAIAGSERPLVPAARSLPFFFDLVLAIDSTANDQIRLRISVGPCCDRFIAVGRPLLSPSSPFSLDSNR